MTDLLGVQIDAAINAGNSGGPVLNEEGACVGIAFQSLKDGDTEGIGFVIPTPVIAHFLADYARNGAFTGFPSVGFEWQPLEAPALRASLGMGGAKGGKGGQQKGVLVTRVEPTAPGGDALRRGDVLMAFDGAPISCDGTVPFRAGERIAFGHLVAQRCAPASLAFCALALRLAAAADVRPCGAAVQLCGRDRAPEPAARRRAGAPRRALLVTASCTALTPPLPRSQLEVTVPLGTPTVLIPPFFSGVEPPYLIVAGLVFLPVSEPYLKAEFGEDYEYEAPVRLLDKLFNAQARAPGEQVVVLSQVLAAEVNVGYEDITNVQVLAFNGEPVTSLAGLTAAVARCADRFFRFDVDSGETVVLDAAKARAPAPLLPAARAMLTPAACRRVPRRPRS